MEKFINNSLFFIVFIFLFPSCIALHINKNFSFLEGNHFLNDKYKIYASPTNYNTYLFYGIIPETHIGTGDLKIAIELRSYGFSNVSDIKINSCIIKKNKKIINKKLYFEVKKKENKNNLEITFKSNKFSLFTTKKDIIEIIFDLDLKIENKIINKIVTAKYKAEKYKEIIFDLSSNENYYQYDFFYIDENGKMREIPNNLNLENLNKKYINTLTGQEAVYDGYYNKGQLITTELINNTIDPDQKANYINAKGTYNYVTVITPKKTDNIFQWLGKAILTPITFIGHKILDDLPYQLGGKVRGKDPKKVPIQLEKINGKFQKIENN